VFDEREGARHLSFFTELASLQDGDPSWRAVSAGLVVLRLVDTWIDEGVAAVAANGWGLRSVEAAIEEVDAGLPARSILDSVVTALKSSPPNDVRAIAPRLLAYGRALDLDAKWALAADVYETVIAHVHPAEESDVAITAHLRLAMVLRHLGELDRSASTYETVRSLAHASGDLVGALRAEVGSARIATLRGNLPSAEETLDRVIREAAEHRIADVHAHALHERADVAYLRGQYDVAVRLAYQALEEEKDPSNRDRLLADIAASFYMLGARSAARDAYLILEATCREQYLRWIAEINLMEIASVEGSAMLFERYRRALLRSDLAVNLQAQLHLHIGEGYARLGDLVAAKNALLMAQDIATQFSFNQVLFAVEERLSNLPQLAAPPTAGHVPEHLVDIADKVHQMGRDMALY
jgi:tetratricopeptide (TPR) repeat protein